MSIYESDKVNTLNALIPEKLMGYPWYSDEALRNNWTVNSGETLFQLFDNLHLSQFISKLHFVTAFDCWITLLVIRSITITNRYTF